MAALSFLQKSPRSFQISGTRRTLHLATWTSLFALDPCCCQGFTTQLVLLLPPLELHAYSKPNILQHSQLQNQPKHSSYLERGGGHRSIFTQNMPAHFPSNGTRRSTRISSRVSNDKENIENDGGSNVQRGKRSHSTSISTQKNRNVRRKAVRPKQKHTSGSKPKEISGETPILSTSATSIINSPKSVKKSNRETYKGGKEDLKLLLDLGPLIQGKMIKRPSAAIRSPYVADVEIVTEDPKGGNGLETIIVQAHSPALDVGGLCSPGATVFMSKRPPGGKTSHVIELVSTMGPSSSNEEKNDDLVLVGAHPRLGELLAEEVLKRGLLQQLIRYRPAVVSEKKKTRGKDSNKEDERPLTDGVVLYKQQTYNDSRVDFELVDYSSTDDIASVNNAIVPTKKALIEVKNVVCSDYSQHNAPEKTGPNHCVIIAPPNSDGSTETLETGISGDTAYQRSALFPWGRKGGQTFEGKKVVSERAIKHVRNLAKLVSSEKENDLESIVLFVINRSDCEKMRACHEACPVFASELASFAKQDGCSVVSFSVKWTKEGKAYFLGIVPVDVNNGNR